MLLGAAIGIIAPLGAAGRVEPIQAQNQAPPPEGFRIIGNVYWVGGEYGSYLITTPQGHILHDTGTNEMHDVIVSNVKTLGFDVDSPHANFRAIADSHGRIMVVMTHNTDIGDSMEREGDDPAYFAAFSPEGYALATNVVLYALTH